MLLGFELSVKKVASGKFFSTGVKASIDPRSVSCEAEQIPPSAPRKKRECVSSLSFFSAYAIMQYISKIDANIRGSTTKQT